MTRSNSTKGKTVRETLKNKKTAFRTLDCPLLGWEGKKLLNITITSLLTICSYVVKDISVQQYDFSSQEIHLCRPDKPALRQLSPSYFLVVLAAFHTYFGSLIS